MSTKKTKLPMTQKQYLKRDGTCCPYCRCDSVSGGPVEVNGGAATQEVGCDTCMATWTDTYVLIGYAPA